MTRPRRPHVRLLAAVGAALLPLGVALPAHAYPEAPGIIQEELKLDCLPPCTLCHVRPEGGPGFLKDMPATVLPGTQGYGNFLTNLSVAGGGLPKEGNLNSFINAFQRTPCGGMGNTMNPQGLPCDSDADGRTDIKELQDGTDPDVKDVKGPYSCVTPQYGCGASIKPLPADETDVGRSVALVAALGVGLVLLRRVRR
jgi:hypothetical protein